ncbi:MAG TPA: lysozyme inhibitor LprI family protein [Acidobacteriota bacterium]|nr:lysozyme inhibitor LprI family protein [Acidobacteriota bacterium]
MPNFLDNSSKMKPHRSAVRLGQACGFFLTCILALTMSLEPDLSYAQSRKPTEKEVTAIKDCVNKNKDNIDEGERQCLLSLVADRCIGDVGAAPGRKLTDCYEIEGSIWNDLLNQNYKHLLDTLDDEQKVKARTMQRAWIAYRDTTCQFYWDKIQGTMANHMKAACATRESARRAMLLAFFARF